MDASSIVSTVFYIALVAASLMWAAFVLISFHVGRPLRVWCRTISEITYIRKQKTLGRGIVSLYNLLTPLSLGLFATIELMARTEHWWAFGSAISTLIMLVLVHLSPLKSRMLTSTKNFSHLLIAGLVFTSLTALIITLPLGWGMKISYGVIIAVMIVMMATPKWRKYSGIPQKLTIIYSMGAIITSVVTTAMSL